MLNDPALLDEFDVVENTPVAVGAKRKKYWQLAKGGTPPAQFCNALKGGYTPPPAKLVNVRKLWLVMVTTRGSLVVPTPTGPKSNERGVTRWPLERNVLPRPCNSTTNVPALVYVDDVSVNVPAAVGEKR
jgi:hypothetical protein